MKGSQFGSFDNNICTLETTISIMKTRTFMLIAVLALLGLHGLKAQSLLRK
jgi:hypothetical protein